MIPIGLAVNVVQAAIGREILLDDATMEVELRDSVSGERQIVVVDPKALRHGKDEPSWKALDTAFKFYASRMRQRFDSARGR